MITLDRSGLISVTRALIGGETDKREKCEHHRVDISENPLELYEIKPNGVEKALKKRMSICSMIGIFFICLAIIGLIAIGIAMYIECMTKEDNYYNDDHTLILIILK